MIVLASRDSVCAGDDTEEHVERFVFADGAPLEAVVSGIAAARFLASIIGGRATWSVVSGVPVAIVAQEWERPRMIAGPSTRLDWRGGALHLHFRYHAQRDPDLVAREIGGQG